MLAATNLLPSISYAPTLHLKNPSRTNNLNNFLPLLPQNTTLNINFPDFVKPHNSFRSRGYHRENVGLLPVCHGAFNSESSNYRERSVLGFEGNGKEGWIWTTTRICLLVFYGALWCFALFISPDKTQEFDMHFLKKLFNLQGDVSFRINKVFMNLWYMLGLWPFVYGMLLIPTGRSSKGKIPVWPFLILQFTGGGIYVLLSYFLLWNPPPSPVEESELKQWPLNFLESKLTSVIILVAGLGLTLSAAQASGSVWTEFYEYCKESRLILLSCVDFLLLAAFAPFWVYNDMSARKWYKKGFWLLPVSLVPLFGPVLYLILRPSLSELAASLKPTLSEQK